MDGAVIEFEPVWGDNVYEVVYHANNGTNKTTTAKLTNGKKFTFASAPGSFKMSNWVIKGWSTAPHEANIRYSIDYSFKQTISAEEAAALAGDRKNGQTIDLYAEWGPVEYKITYKNLSKTAGNVNPNVYNGVDGLPSFSDPVDNGYKFEGWYSDSKLKKRIYSIAPGEKGNKTVYAKMTPINYSITYNLNGGTNNKSNPTSYNITKYVSLKNPSKTGYTFDGWYLNGSKVKSIEKGKFWDIVLEAKWSPITYGVKYYLSSGKAISEKHAYGEEFAVLSADKVNSSGKYLTSWNTKSNGKGTSYEPGQTVKNLTAKSGTVTLYAIWAKRIDPHYVVTYHANEGYADDGSSQWSQKLKPGQTLSKNEKFKRDGMTFIGWKRDNEGNLIEDGAKVDVFGALPKNEHMKVELYSQWGLDGIDLTKLKCQDAGYNGNYSAAIDAKLNSYIVQKNELQATLKEGKVILFFFEGATNQATDVRSCAAMFAVKLVEEADGVKYAEIIYYDSQSSTLPDFPTTVDIHEKEDYRPATLKDGIYNIISFNHNGYAALQLEKNRQL